LLARREDTRPEAARGDRDRIRAVNVWGGRYAAHGRSRLLDDLGPFWLGGATRRPDLEDAITLPCLDPSVHDVLRGETKE
jgi:hypothetical protein